MSTSILDVIVDNTKLFLEDMPKSVRKKKGQFFTSLETAKYMAELFDTTLLPENVSVCDPGAGTGILSAAIIDRLNKIPSVKTIDLTCYETDTDVQKLLIKNLELMKSMSAKPLEYKLITENYLLSQQHDFEGDLLAEKNPTKYDLIIANPPYLRVMRDDAQALAKR